MNAGITAMHYCLPNGRLTNQELEQRFDPKLVKSIVKMSGIQERRIAAPGQTASDLAFVAAQRLMTARQIDPQTIDLILFASQTGDYQIPATACVLHGRLGLGEHCAAFDVNLGCSAFPYVLAIANGMISSGLARRALVLNAETLSTVIHPRDRGLVPLHGDGAVATLLEPAEGAYGLTGFLLGTDGTGAKHLLIPASGARQPRTADTKREVTDESGSVRTDEHLQMSGPAIFHFSVYKVPEIIRAALTKFGRTVGDLDLVLLHQANKTMLDLIYKALGVPAEKRFFFMEQVGNTSGVATPLLLAEALRQGKVAPRSRTLLTAFGVGLSWGVVQVEWSEQVPAPVQAATDYE